MARFQWGLERADNMIRSEDQYHEEYALNA